MEKNRCSYGKDAEGIEAHLESNIARRKYVTSVAASCSRTRGQPSIVSSPSASTSIPSLSAWRLFDLVKASRSRNVEERAARMPFDTRKREFSARRMRLSSSNHSPGARVRAEEGLEACIFEPLEILVGYRERRQRMCREKKEAGHGVTHHVSIDGGHSRSADRRVSLSSIQILSKPAIPRVSRIGRSLQRKP